HLPRKLRLTRTLRTPRVPPRRDLPQPRTPRRPLARRGHRRAPARPQPGWAGPPARIRKDDAMTPAPGPRHRRRPRDQQGPRPRAREDRRLPPVRARRLHHRPEHPRGRRADPARLARTAERSGVRAPRASTRPRPRVLAAALAATVPPAYYC